MAPKSPDDRRAEAARLTAQLVGVGLPQSDVRPVLDKLRAFARGEGASGSVAVPGTPIVLEYLFSTQAHVVSHIRVTSSRRQRA
jgi:hypothetical protein